MVGGQWLARRMNALLATCLVLAMNTAYCAASDIELDGEVAHQDAILGLATTFTCDTLTHLPDDTLMLLVWYKDDTPVYSYDARNHTHWKDSEFALNSRLMLQIEATPTTLTLDPLIETDEGLYRCRVDFNLGQTRNTAIQLTIIILPSQPFFLDEIGMKVEKKVGPLHEGDNLVLSCLVIGGKPPPTITWWQGGTLLDKSDGPSEIPGVRENELYLPLGREYANKHIQCAASNNNQTAPLMSDLFLELYVAPESVKILSSNQPLSEGETYSITCFTNGSYPAPEISWWLDEQMLVVQFNVSNSFSSNGTISVIQFLPRKEDNGKSFACSATNTLMAPSKATRMDRIILNIYYKPVLEVVKMTVGSASLTLEYDMVHLRCEIRANPWVMTLRWLYDGEKLLASDNVNITSQDLVIANISREQSGRYSCEAENIEGLSESDSFNILVTYTPQCQTLGSKLVIKEKVHFVCVIDSMPSPLSYIWTVTVLKSGLAKNVTTNNETLDLMSVNMSVDEDLLVQCRGINEVGLQVDPCWESVFVGSLRPQTPPVCDLSEQSDAVLVDCQSVSNATDYIFSVWRLSERNNSLVLARNVSSSYSYVKFANLSMEVGDEVGVRACNKFGCGRPYALRPSPVLLASRVRWWHGFFEKDFGLSIGIIVVVLVFISSSLFIRRVIMRHTKNKDSRKTQVIQLLQLNEIHSREYLDTLERRRIENSSTLISDRNNIVNGMICADITDLQSKEELPPAVNRHVKPRLKNFQKEYSSESDVSLTLLKCQCNNRSSLVGPPDITTSHIVDCNYIYSEYMTLNKESSV